MMLSALVGGHVEVIDASAPLRQAARRMAEKEIGSLLVVDGGGIVGIFTEHDVTVAVAHDADQDLGATGDWMTDFPVMAEPDWEVERALDVMVEHGFRHLPVVEGGAPVGMVSMKDLVWIVRAGSDPPDI